MFAAAQVVPNARAYFYSAGTTTPVSVYSDVLLTTAYTQPVVADANGVFAEIFLTPGTAYKVDLQTSAGVSLTGYPADNQLAIPASSASVDSTETAGETLAAGTGVYLSDGSGGKNAGQLYKWDSANTYSSTSPYIGIVPNAITSGSQGTFRQGGQAAGLSSLTPGADYYVGTAGALTVTAPTNARFVGRADSASSILLAGNPSGALLAQNTMVSPTIKTSILTPSATALGHGVCQGRLTGTTALPVTTADVSNITTIFFTPYLGNNIGLYDGSTNWTILPFSEISIALGTLTSGLPYDIFAYNNSGAVALRSPVAWTSTVARATALVLQNGIWVKTGATTDRYLGTFYTTSTTQTQDTAAQRLVYNYYNRVPRPVTRVESTASWTYTTATWRQANGATANQIAIVQGVAETAIDLRLTALVNNSTGGIGVAIAIGAADSTTTPITNGIVGSLTAQNGINVGATASATTIPAVGYHFYAGLEESTATGTTTWIGSGTLAGVAVSEWGLTGLWIN